MGKSGIYFMKRAGPDLTAWLQQDPDVCKKIGDLLEDIQRHPYSGLGKPELLKHDYQGWWSRRITGEHRLVYRVEDGTIYVLQCRGHYDN